MLLKENQLLLFQFIKIFKNDVIEKMNEINENLPIVYIACVKENANSKVWRRESSVEEKSLHRTQIFLYPGKKLGRKRKSARDVTLEGNDQWMQDMHWFGNRAMYARTC